jgi:hypothetical protein
MEISRICTLVDGGLENMYQQIYNITAVRLVLEIHLLERR